MILKLKICGVSDLKTLNFIVNHNYPPQFVGFIVNYTKSKRYVNIKNLKELLKINKNLSLNFKKEKNPKWDKITIACCEHSIARTLFMEEENNDEFNVSIDP